MLKWSLFHWISLRGCATIPLCHFHSFFDVLAFLLPLSEGLRNTPPRLRAILNSGKACALLYLPLSSRSLFCAHPPSRKIFLAVQSTLAFFGKRATAGSSHTPSSASKPYASSTKTEKSYSFFLLLLPSVPSISTSPWEPSPLHGLSRSLLASYPHVFFFFDDK